LRDFMANKNTLLAGILFKQWFQSKEGLNQHNRNDRACFRHYLLAFEV
jgi:hypothetical protein